MIRPALICGLVALPAFSGQASAQAWQETAVEQAIAFNRDNLPETCEPATFPEGYDFVNYWQLAIGEDTAAREVLLVQLPCMMAAYSRIYVFVMVDREGHVNPVLFPAPQIEVTYAGGTIDGAVKDLRVTGTTDRREVTNPSFDPSSRVMTEIAPWRGVGDAQSGTRWGYVMGRFQLAHFAVDATYDGEHNPVVLIDRDVW